MTQYTLTLLKTYGKTIGVCQMVILLHTIAIQNAHGKILQFLLYIDCKSPTEE